MGNSGSVSFLPNDIILEVLLRLPVKSLVRFCCVCKFWNNIIKYDHMFIKSHLKYSLNRRSPTHSNVLLSSLECERVVTHNHEVQKFINADENCLSEAFNLGCDFNFTGSFNGVLCFNKYCFSCEDLVIYIWNPALHQCRTLPHGVYKVSINIVLSFVYDDLSDDYKVVKISGDDDGFKIETYSLRSNSWKAVEVIPFAQKVSWYVCISGVVHNGSLHWLISHQGKAYFYVYDMNQEVQETVLVDDSFERHQLGVFKESLCMMCLCSGDMHWELQVMNADNSWTKKFVWNSSICPLATTIDITSGKLLASCQTDKRTRSVLANGEHNLVSSHCRLVLYHIESQKIEFMRGITRGGVTMTVSSFASCTSFSDPGPPRKWFTPYFVSNYVESLVSIFPENLKRYENCVSL